MFDLTFSRKFFVSRHISDLISRCSRSFFCPATAWATGRYPTSRIPGHSHQQAQLCLSSLVGFCFNRRPERAQKHFYDDELNSAIGATAHRSSLAFVTRPMNDSSTGSPTTHAIFYIHFYHHGAIDTTRFGNKRMTLNFLIAHQNLKIRTS